MNAHWMRFEPDVTRHYQDCCQGHFDALRLQWHFKFLELGTAAWPILWVITLDTIMFFHFATRLLLNLYFSSIVTMSMSILPFSLSLASESCSECQLFQSFEPLDCCQFNLEELNTPWFICISKVLTDPLGSYLIQSSDEHLYLPSQTYYRVFITSAPVGLNGCITFEDSL